MKRFLVATLAAWTIIGAAALGPSGASAAVRHLPISHAPAPPLTTIEISSSANTPNGTNAACATCPQSNNSACTGCPPKAVQIPVVQLPL